MNNIKWVKNTLTSPLEGELDIIPVKRKCDYPREGTIVKLTHIKDDCPHAEIRFNTPRFEKGERKGCSEGLCYLHYTPQGEWKQVNGDWKFIKAPIQQSTEEGYFHSITNTYGMTNEGLKTMTNQMLEIKNILIRRVLANREEN